MANSLAEILAARALHAARPATRPIIQLHNPNVFDAIRAALRAVNADIVVDDDGYVVATYDGHVRRLENNHQRCDCLAWHLRFMQGDQRIDPPPKLAHQFFSHARELAWFRQEHRGPCPRCAAKGKRA